MAWHREGFRLFWTWISRRKRTGLPEVSPAIRALILKMAAANPLWGAPRIHGELLKLGIPISERTVSRLLPRKCRPPSQTWKVFLDNHINQLVSIDFFTVPTATFGVLFVLVVLGHRRRRLIHFNVTEHPTAAWTAQQILEAFTKDTAPRYLIRDRGQTYGECFQNRLRDMGSTGVLRLRRQQARDLWVFNRNEMNAKELVDDGSRDRTDVIFGAGVRHFRMRSYLDPSISASVPDCLNWLTPHCPRTGAAPAALTAYWKSPFNKHLGIDPP